jgi:hypothetical protein
MMQRHFQRIRPRRYLGKVSGGLILGEKEEPTLRVVVADGVPGVHSGEDRVRGRARGNSASDLKGVLPDDLGEMSPITRGLLRALLSVKGCKEGSLAIPLIDDGILKSALKGPGI